MVRYAYVGRSARVYQTAVYTAAGAVSSLSLTTFAGLKAAKHPSASPCFLSNKARALATRSSSLSEDSIHVCPPRTETQNNKAPAPSLPAGCYKHGLWRTHSSSSGDDTERGDLNGCVSSSNLLRSRFTKKTNFGQFSPVFLLLFPVQEFRSAAHGTSRRVSRLR